MRVTLLALPEELGMTSYRGCGKRSRAWWRLWSSVRRPKVRWFLRAWLHRLVRRRLGPVVAWPGSAPSKRLATQQRHVLACVMSDCALPGAQQVPQAFEAFGQTFPSGPRSEGVRARTGGPQPCGTGCAGRRMGRGCAPQAAAVIAEEAAAHSDGAGQAMEAGGRPPREGRTSIV